MEVERILASVEGTAIGAVVSSDDYPGSALAAIIAKRLGLPGPDPRIVLICQHKYLSRVAQTGLVPDAVPPFTLIDVAVGAPLPDEASFPLFVKPVKSFFSIGADKVFPRPRLPRSCRAGGASISSSFRLERLLERYAGETIGSRRLIGEGVLKGEQVTIEGYAHRGKVEHRGRGQFGHVPWHHRLLALRLSFAIAGKRAGAHGRHRRRR